jgi:hypothetical protein
MALCAAVVAAWAGGAVAADDQQYRAAEGLAVYLGVMPAALVKGRPEAAMHGGVPGGRHAYHVMVAVFDEASGERLADLRVKAAVASPGMAAIEKPLETMRIADTVTYGNYFDLIGAGPFRIRVDVLRPGAATPKRVEFAYEHKLR